MKLVEDIDEVFIEILADNNNSLNEVNIFNANTKIIQNNS